MHFAAVVYQKSYNLTMASNTYNSSNLTNGIQLEKAPTMLTAVLITTSLWIMIINLLVFSCLITSRSAKKSFVNLQLLSLSVTDMLVGAFSIPVTLTFKITGSFPTYGVCASLFYLYIVSQAATLNHALIICVHRLITVKRKHRNLDIRPKYLSVFLQVLSVWIMSFVVISIPFILYGRFGETLSFCSLNTLFGDNYTNAIGIFTGGLLTPHICLNIVYSNMFLFLKRKWKQIDVAHNRLRENRMARIDSERTGPKTTVAPINVKEATNQRNSRSWSTNNSSEDEPAQKRSHLDVHRYQNGKRHIGANRDTASVDTSSSRSSRLEQRRRRSIEHTNGRKVGEQSRLGGINGQRVLVTIGILLVVLNVFMTPLNFLILFETLHTGYLSRSVKFIFMNMAILNSALNPVINVFRVRPFKEALKHKALKLCRFFCK